MTLDEVKALPAGSRLAYRFSHYSGSSKWVPCTLLGICRMKVRIAVIGPDDLRTVSPEHLSASQEVTSQVQKGPMGLQDPVATHR